LKDCKNEKNSSGCFPGNILQIITAARYAQLNGPQSFHKPLVITVYYHYEKEAAQLVNLIQAQDSGQDEQPGIKNLRNTIAELRLANHFSIASSENSTTKNLLKHLKNDEIILLSLGPLPKKIFDGLFNYTNTNIWSPIREGNNSFSSLILTGRPHLRCGRNWELGGWGMQDRSLQQTFASLYNNIGFCRGMTTWDKNKNLYQDVGELLIEANDTQSSLSRYFVDMKKMVTHPKNSRIDYLLEEVLRLANHS